MTSTLIAINAREAQLRRMIRRHLKDLGFVREATGHLRPPDFEKETYRRLHSVHRAEKIAKNKAFLATRANQLLSHFARGDQVDPARVDPELVPVTQGTEASELFRFASLLWRVPVSEGYGRRMRYLVRDRENEKLVGLIGLGDPVFNLRVRDEFIGWNHEMREQALVHMMDAFVLGAVPPYNLILGSKLVASLVRSREVVDGFNRRYGNAVGVISGKKKKPRLVLVTTTSALGRSSVYNRLKLGGATYFRSIGYTQGWGHFHVPDELFEQMRAYLRYRRDRYAANNRFGQGPNWRLRVVRRTMECLGLGAESVHHGLRREVFVATLANNALKILRGEQIRPNYVGLPTIDEIGALARERWLIPRANRTEEFRVWDPSRLLAELGYRDQATLHVDRISV